MLETKNQLTEQEHFWKGEFGDEYISGSYIQKKWF